MQDETIESISSSVDIWLLFTLQGDFWIRHQEGLTVYAVETSQ